MNLGPLALGPVAYIANNMRASDRREIMATKSHDDPDRIAIDVLQRWGPYGWVAWDTLPVAAFGAAEMWPGVWSVWMFATDNFDNVGRGVTRFVKRVMLPSLVEQGCHRLEAHSIDGHDQAHRWLRYFGAVEEARLRRYGRNGEDFLIFRLDMQPPCVSPPPA